MATTLSIEKFNSIDNVQINANSPTLSFSEDAAVSETSISKNNKEEKKIERIKKSIERSGSNFLNLIYTPKEIEYCESTRNAKYCHYAGRFASKEAYSKSIGTGISKDFGWKDIEILNDSRGKPYIHHLKENEFSNDKYYISISHTDEYATAFVVREE